MGIVSVKSLNEGSHCHRFYVNGEKNILICKNKNCDEHMCAYHNCKKNKYFIYWKYNYRWRKIQVNYCENNCSCHLTQCVGFNKLRTHNKMVKKHSNNVNDAYDDLRNQILICNRCHSSDDYYHTLSLDSGYDLDFDD